MPDAAPYFPFELNRGQAEAFDALCAFAQQHTDQVFILKGYAGTGKTTLMKGLIGYLREQEIRYELLASTGRAAKILSEKTGVLARTIHSCIYVFAGLGDKAVFILKRAVPGSRMIYIVDESSMISDQPVPPGSFAEFGDGRLLQNLLEYDPEGRFIFVGDPCQLPPVNQRESPALNPASYAAYPGKPGVREAELTEVARQAAGSGILQVASRLRALVQQPETSKWPSLPVHAAPHIALHRDPEALLGAYLRARHPEDLSRAILICHSNQQRMQLNARIRHSLGRTGPDPVPGDVLMVTQNTGAFGLHNGDLLRFLRFTGRTDYKAGLVFAELEVQPEQGEPQTVLCFLDLIHSGNLNLSTNQHQQLMIDFKARMQAQRIKEGTTEYNDQLRSDPWLNAVKAVYGFAVTCHKCQGGEWQEAFIWMDNKIAGMPRPNVYQWWYTAMTRAVQRVHLEALWFVR
ncbi:MAG: AAA family ATPase [Bacteroidia bacterium]|nr:AAA family ATPase [Bacteroidia bacterium]